MNMNIYFQVFRESPQEFEAFFHRVLQLTIDLESKVILIINLKKFSKIHFCIADSNSSLLILLLCINQVLYFMTKLWVWGNFKI